MRDRDIETERVVWDGQKAIPVSRNRHQGKFIRGPIPIDWLSEVIDIRGTVAIRTALFLVYEHSLQGTPKEIVASNVGAARFKLTRWAKSKGLIQLERAGLIRIAQRKPGRSLRVELLNYSMTKQSKGTHA